jgi:uncharacterized protein (TIGR02271 family)
MSNDELFSQGGNNDKQMVEVNEEPEMVIPVIEESLSVGKRTVETGRVKVVKKVEERIEAVDVNLLEDEYVIEQVAINEYVDGAAPQIRQEGDTIILPVVKEVIVKRLLLAEEVRITKKTKQRNEHQDITLRKEAIIINRSDPEN